MSRTQTVIFISVKESGCVRGSVPGAKSRAQCRLRPNSPRAPVRRMVFLLPVYSTRTKSAYQPPHSNDGRLSADHAYKRPRAPVSQDSKYSKTYRSVPQIELFGVEASLSQHAKDLVFVGNSDRNFCICHRCLDLCTTTIRLDPEINGTRRSDDDLLSDLIDGYGPAYTPIVLLTLINWELAWEVKISPRARIRL